MKNDKEFNTYNQINKLFTVKVMCVKEVINNPKLQDNKCLVLIPKTHIKMRKQRKAAKTLTTKEILLDFVQSTNRRLDKYDELFKAHGWIK